MILTQDKLSSFPASMMNIIIKLVHQHHHHQIVNGCPVLIYMQKRPLLKAWGWFLRPIRKSDPAATGFTWWYSLAMVMTKVQSCNDDDDDDNMSVSHLSLRLSSFWCLRLFLSLSFTACLRGAGTCPFRFCQLFVCSALFNLPLCFVLVGTLVPNGQIRLKVSYTDKK